MCLEKTARYLLGKITNRDAKNVWKLIQLPGPPSRPASSRRFLKLSARALLQMLARAGAGLAAPSQQLARGWRLARLCDLCRWASSSPGQLCSPHTDCARPRPAPAPPRACCFLSPRAALAESENEKDRESLAARPRPGTRGRGGRLSSVRRVAWGSAGESSCWPRPTANYGATKSNFLQAFKLRDQTECKLQRPKSNRRTIQRHCRPTFDTYLYLLYTLPHSILTSFGCVCSDTCGGAAL